MSIVEVRRCLICGEVFVINAQQYNKIYCCDCKKTADFVRKRDYHSKYADKIREYQKMRYIPCKHTYICQICGKENTAKQGVTKYCLECLKRAKGKLGQYYYNRKTDDSELPQI